MEKINERQIAKEKLSFYIENPGYFSILVLGESGTGKNYIIDQLLSKKIESEDIEEPHNLNKLELQKAIKEKKEEKYGFYNAFEIGETEFEIEKIFSKEIILIKNIEELSDKQQNILFKSLSTGSNGEIGLGENRGLKRIIFTSTFDVSILCEGEKRLNNNFWDRISQLVVKLPSFKDFSSNIRKDFNSVWSNMDFKEYPKLPKDGDFSQWLTNNCGTFAGNFRDLDKIAILWHQYRIIEYSKYPKQDFKSEVEARIFRKVRSDFEKFNHFPTQKTDTTNIFEFEKGKTWKQIERSFKSEFKKWAKREYKTIIKATTELNMPARKMDKW